MISRDEIHHKIRHATSDIVLQLRHIKNNLRAIENVAEQVPDCATSIHIKNDSVMQEIIAVPWHPILREVFSWVCAQWPGQIVITSGHREGDTGVHGVNPLRGIDLRSREMVNPQNVEYAINQAWDYGKPPYQVCTFHQTVMCKKCLHKFRVDPMVGILASTACPKCHAEGTFLKDFGQHFHLQSRRETKKYETLL